MILVQRTKWMRAWIIATLAFLFVLLNYSAKNLDALENFTWDLRVKLLATNDFAQNDIAIFMIDQSSLDWAQEVNGLGWPWPRELYSILNAFAQRAGATAIVYDLLFLEDSIYGVSDDQRFAQSMGVIPTYLAAYPEHLPIQALRQASKMLGNVGHQPDLDGIYRQTQPYVFRNNQALATLGLTPWLNQEDPLEISSSSLFAELNENSLKIPLNSTGHAILNFRRNIEAYPTFSTAQIIQSELRFRDNESHSNPTLDPSILKNKFIFVGSDAPGLFDLRPTPISKIYPGVGLHATFLDNLINENFIRKQSTFSILVFTAILTITSTLVFTFISSIFKFILTLTLLVSSLILLSALTYLQGIWWNLTTPSTATLLAISSVFLSNYQLEGREKRFIRNAFQQYLSPEVIQELVKNPDTLQLGGQRQEISIFFSDLEGFSKLAEQLDPKELSDFLNDYLSEMSDIVLELGGTIDKYEGDAIIAFWNAPVIYHDHAARAIQAGKDCLARLAQLQPKYQQWLNCQVNMRIGIHTGLAVVGNMGSSKRFDYTMIGDAVNLASRLEGANKVFSSHILVSEETYHQAGKPEYLYRIGQIRVVGRSEPVKVYTLKPKSSNDEHRIFEKALDLFERGSFPESRSMFSEIMHKNSIAQNYVHLINELGQVSDDWNGVIELTKK
ncbi:adenylate/guanylate cyclase domain-containing protein [Nitrincola tapanii]|uniref:Adenylate/guanylate cyclase domain-containing protein n=1 Tax=Nitrincola tapanii TaxID=1708751 RepID=A0A5A9W6Z3_9GAMM|nr:adenylate/guanylate cyclase domain-containing protein [Nitrincola tapanii]KAA0876283.1 adenylate/guanylate cyclase domain-containing protein [Nitrincola tapanii]